MDWLDLVVVAPRGASPGGSDGGMGFARRVTSWIGLLGRSRAGLVVAAVPPAARSRNRRARRGSPCPRGSCWPARPWVSSLGRTDRQPAWVVGRSNSQLATCSTQVARLARRRGRRRPGPVDRAADDGRRPRLAGSAGPRVVRRSERSTRPWDQPPGVLDNLSQSLGLGPAPRVFERLERSPDVVAAAGELAGLGLDHPTRRSPPP